MKPDGEIQWEGRHVDLAELKQWLELTHQEIPPHKIIFRATAASDCTMAEQVRQVLDQSAMCKEGYCVEGERWDAWLKRGR